MLIDEVYILVQQLAAKNQFSGYLSPAEYSQYAQLAQLDIITERYNSIKTLGYGSTNKLDEIFSEIKAVATLPVTGGTITKPTDFLYYSTAHAYYIFNGEGRLNFIDYVNDVEWMERVSSEIERPDKDFPIIRALGDTFEISPSTVTQVNLTYLQVPLLPFWNYTASGKSLTFVETGGSATNPNTGVTAGNSTDFTLTQSEKNLLVFKIAKYFGIEITDRERYAAIENENIKDE